MEGCKKITLCAARLLGSVCTADCDTIYTVKVSHLHNQLCERFFRPYFSNTKKPNVKKTSIVCRLLKTYTSYNIIVF